MHNILVRDGVVAHVWRGPIPDGIPNTFAVAPDSAHVGDRWENGTAVPAPKPVTVDEINAECERRILAVLPLTRQLNIVDEGTAAELQDMKDKRNALRSCARALILIQPSPANYRDDRYWVGAPWGSEPRQSPADRRPPDMQMHQNGGGYPSGMHAQYPYGFGMGGNGTNQPIIMMQAPAPAPAAAPIIINGAAPGTTVIQGPAHVAPPHAMWPASIAPPFLHPVGVVSAPAPVPGLMPPEAGQSAVGSRQSDTPTPAASPIDRDEILYETAGRALAGQEGAILYMTRIATVKGQSWQDYCEQKLRERFQRFDAVLTAEAS